MGYTVYNEPDAIKEEMLEKSDIIFFLEGRHVPSSRFRVCQYEKLLQSSGLTYRFLYTIPSKYLYVPKVIQKSVLRYPLLTLEVLLVVVTRIIQILIFARRSRVIFLQRDLLHGIQIPFLEKFLFLWVRVKRDGETVRIVFDVDDTIFRNRRDPNNRRLEKKISQVAKGCDAVIVGNTYLEQFFSPLAPCTVIPTTINCKRFISDRLESQGTIVVGWTGAAPNLPYLAQLEPILMELQAHFQFKILIISERGASNPFSHRLRNVHLKAWSERDEVRDLAELDIGLMPLPDDDWTRGKCGFKVLQYMALEIAAIASPVGVNTEIIEHGVNGLLAHTSQEWAAALSELLIDAAKRKNMAQRGRETVEQRYAHDVWYPRWIKSVCGEGAS